MAGLGGISSPSVYSQMGKDIYVFMFTDAKSIWDTITKSRSLREIRLMNYIADVRRAYPQNEINKLCLDSLPAEHCGQLDKAKRKSDTP